MKKLSRFQEADLRMKIRAEIVNDPSFLGDLQEAFDKAFWGNGPPCELTGIQTANGSHL